MLSLDIMNLGRGRRDFSGIRPDFLFWLRIFRSRVFGPARAGDEKDHMVAVIQLIKEKLS
jgi:hypothetical protein